MTEGKPKTARALAANVLNRFNIRRYDAAKILHKLLPQTAERKTATDLVFGVIRNRRCIDMVITKVGSVPTERIPQKSLNILRIAAYELIFCPDTPQYAIVNEAVKQAGLLAGKKNTAFVNAVLRQITRTITHRSISLSQSEAEKTVPQTPLQGCQLGPDLLPNPKNFPAEYLSKTFSLPKWLVQSWLDDFGEKNARRICFASNRRPSIYIRPNVLKTTGQDLAQKFRDENIDFELLSAESMIRLKTHCPVTELPGFEQGLFVVQDLTASEVVKHLAPESGWLIADICAAPGTKTTQMAELMRDKGKIIATDIDIKRLQKVAENCERLGITIVNTITYDNLRDSLSKIGALDAVLVDAPCSNSGVLAKRHEVRFRINEKSIQALMKTQKKLLKFAANLITTNATICYSTCSLQKQENSDLVKDFLSENTSFDLVFERLTLPSAGPPDYDGGYFAIIAKK